MKSKITAIASLLVLSAVLLLGFQNCGESFPMSQELMNDLSSVSASGGPSFSVRDPIFNVSQGEQAVFTIDAASPVSTDVEIKVKTNGDSAIADVDFVDSSTTVVMKAGTSSVSFPVRTKIKSLSTAEKKFSLSIESVNSGSISKPSATATITRSFAATKFKKLYSSRYPANFCGLTMDDKLLCWGAVNESTNTFAPILMTGLDGFVELAMGNKLCARMPGGTVKCTNYTSDGTPAVEEAGLTGVVQLSAVLSTYCAVINDGTLKCWGTLDPSTNTQYARADMGLFDVKSLTLNLASWCALHNDGTVSCLGYNLNGALGDGTEVNRYYPNPAQQVPGLSGVTRLIGGLGYCALVGTDYKCWGSSGLGFGINDTTPYLSPTSVGPLTGMKEYRRDSDHSCMLMTDGSVRCHGLNTFGQFGDGTTISSLTPLVPMRTAPVLDVQVNGYNTCVLTMANTVRCVGASTSLLPNSAGTSLGQPIDDDSIPDLVQIAVGTAHRCALVKSGDVLCTGRNTDGQIGSGTMTTSALVSIPLTKISGTGAPYKKVVAGDNFSCAIRSDNGVDCWGQGSVGQLGSGGTLSSSTPLPVSNLSNVKDIVAGARHSCAILSPDSVWCWGAGNSGQVGVTTLSNAVVPQRVELTGVKQLGLGMTSTCALVTNGTVQCLGIPIGLMTPYLTPVPIGGVGYKYLAVKGTRACVIRSDDGVDCWGTTAAGELGFVSNQYFPTPTPVIGLKAKTLTLGTAHTCAIDLNDRVQCFGSGQFGQLGNATKTISASPLQVRGLSDVKSIMALGAATTAILSDGTIRTWSRREQITTPLYDVGTQAY